MASTNANARYDYYKNFGQNSADTPFHFQIIKCAGYNHKSKFVLPIKPSPNLPNIQSIYLYPSTCFFEGTVLSEGRGTNKQFQVLDILPYQRIYLHLPLIRMREPKNQNYMAKFVMAGT